MYELMDFLYYQYYKQASICFCFWFGFGDSGSLGLGVRGLGGWLGLVGRLEDTEQNRG